MIIDLNELISALTGNRDFQNKTHSFEVGKSYLIRTVTMTQIGKVEAVTDSDIILSSASWIVDTGRFYNALKDGVLSEVEPFPHGCSVSRLAIVDFAPWVHPLPTEQK